MPKIVKKILKQAVFEADGITVAHQAGELFDEDADLDPTWVTDYAIVDEPGLVVAPEKKAEQPGRLLCRWPLRGLLCRWPLRRPGLRHGERAPVDGTWPAAGRPGKRTAGRDAVPALRIRR